MNETAEKIGFFLNDVFMEVMGSSEDLKSLEECVDDVEAVLEHELKNMSEGDEAQREKTPLEKEMEKEYETAMRRRQLQDMVFSLITMSKVFDYPTTAKIIETFLIDPLNLIVDSLKKKHEGKENAELDKEDKLYLKSQIRKIRGKIDEEIIGKDYVRKRDKKPGNDTKDLELSDDKFLKRNQLRKEK